MSGVNYVILACFTSALCQTKDNSRLSKAAHSDTKVAICCVRTMPDFCLMAEYRDHTLQTLPYMNHYLQQFHEHIDIFGEFRASKADSEEAAKAARELAEGQARQSTINYNFKVTATERARIRVEDCLERQQVVDDILQQDMFYFPKLHLRSHYTSQIPNFRTIPLYLTEIMEALHKAWEDAYLRSN